MAPKPTPEERKRAGKSLRDSLKRADQGLWKVAENRPDPIEVLKAAVAHRDPALLPIRWGRMAQSPFYFFRGNAALMAVDLAPWPTTRLHSQLCGDAHLINFGAFFLRPQLCGSDHPGLDEAEGNHFPRQAGVLESSLALQGG